MKIALLTDGIQPYVIGGMQRHSFFLAKYLAARGINVDLYHTTQNRDKAFDELDVFTKEERKYIQSYFVEFPQNDNFPSILSPLFLKRFTEIPFRLPGHYLRRSYRYSERMFEVLKQNLKGVDFIFSKGFTGWKLLEERLTGDCSIGSIPVAVKLHGLNMFQKAPSFRGWLEQFLFRSPVKFIYGKADYVFSYGGKITDITKAIGIEDKKIIEIPTGIEHSWLREKPVNTIDKKRKFLFVGRYERLKGIEELSKAIINCQKKSGLSFQFHFVGPIPEDLRLKNSSDSAVEIIYHGQIKQSDEIKKIMDSSDVLVCPSYSEGMPNVIIEAMSRGMAVIATDVGAVNCLVSEENGFLLPHCSVKNIEEAIKKSIALADDDLMKMKNNSINKIRKNFLWEKVIDKLIAEIERIVR